MRKTADVTIEAEGRDKGKTFRITEMSAAQAEKWAMRAMLPLAKAGSYAGSLPQFLQIDWDDTRAGLAKLAELGIEAFAHIPWHDAEPLIDEMMTCVQFVPDTSTAERRTIARPLLDTDIDEPMTLIYLRDEVVALHVGFSLRAKLSQLRESRTAAPATTT